MFIYFSQSNFDFRNTFLSRYSRTTKAHVQLIPCRNSASVLEGRWLGCPSFGRALNGIFFSFAELIFKMEVQLLSEKYLILILKKIKKLTFECRTCIQHYFSLKINIIFLIKLNVPISDHVRNGQCIKNRLILTKFDFSLYI